MADFLSGVHEFGVDGCLDRLRVKRSESELRNVAAG